MTVCDLFDCRAAVHVARHGGGVRPSGFPNEARGFGERFWIARQQTTVWP
jgi:hypothetical protein